MYRHPFLSYAQREAIETLIYLYEVVQVRRQKDLIEKFATRADMRLLQYDLFPRYCVKMATGSGKTKVLALAIAWHYFNAVVEALKRHGVKKKIAVMEPYYPTIEPRLKGVLGPHGYEIVRFNHMRGKNPTSYSVLTARDMIQAIKSIDGPDIEAIVQFGANLPMAKLADEAERWLDKPVVSINVATYWHACRMNGIDDKLYGFTQLFSRF